MDISFLNEQDKLDVTDKIKELVAFSVKSALDFMKFCGNAEVSVVFTDNNGIRKLNAEHRGIDRITDVLSFPMVEYDENKNPIEDCFDENGCICLGDIVISLERASEQAEEYGHSFEREVGFLTVHSVLHLLGYDHMTDNEEKEMFVFQNEILNEMGLKR